MASWLGRNGAASRQRSASRSIFEKSWQRALADAAAGGARRRRIGAKPPGGWDAAAKAALTVPRGAGQVVASRRDERGARHRAQLALQARAPRPPRGAGCCRRRGGCHASGRPGVSRQRREASSSLDTTDPRARQRGAGDADSAGRARTGSARARLPHTAACMLEHRRRAIANATPRGVKHAGAEAWGQKLRARRQDHPTRRSRRTSSGERAWREAPVAKPDDAI